MRIHNEVVKQCTQIIEFFKTYLYFSLSQNNLNGKEAWYTTTMRRNSSAMLSASFKPFPRCSSATDPNLLKDHHSAKKYFISIPNLPPSFVCTPIGLLQAGKTAMKTKPSPAHTKEKKYIWDCRAGNLKHNNLRYYCFLLSRSFISAFSSPPAASSFLRKG